jgi:hypothetical protein
MNRAYYASARWLTLGVLALSAACGTDAPDAAAPPGALHQGLMAADLAITGMMQSSTDARDYTLTFTIKNQGNADASNAKVSFQVATGAVVRTLGGTGWSCDNGTQGVHCTTQTLAAGAQSQVSMDLEVPYGQTNATVTATVTSDATDPTPGDDSVTLVPPGDPQTLHLIGGGLGCSMLQRAMGTELPCVTLLGALLGLVNLLRRRAPLSKAGGPL